MNESVLDVLRYLFDHDLDDETLLDDDRDAVLSELTQVGFAEEAVEKAIDWLEGLAASERDLPALATAGTAPLRVYDRSEQACLDAPARGYLLSLEQAGVLDPVQRELVIDRLVALEGEAVDLDQLEWVVRLLLEHARPAWEVPWRWPEGGAIEPTVGLLH